MLLKRSILNNKNLLRFNATVSCVADGNGNYRFVVPFPTKGPRTILMDASSDVQSLIASILVEDKSVRHAHLTDDQGIRIADVEGKQLGPADGIGQDKYNKVINILRNSEASRQCIDMKEYFTQCEDIGVTKEKARIVLKSLEESGEVLHIQDNIELQDKIILKPELILSSVAECLESPIKKETLQQKIAQLESLKVQHQKLHEIHLQCYQSAHKVAQTIAVCGFSFLCVQFYVFGYFTWYNEAGWDIMEPITWFTGVVEMVIGGFFYYLYRGSEYSHMDLRDGLMNWIMSRKYRSIGFNEVEYDRQNAQIKQLQAEVDLLTRSQNAIDKPVNNNKE